MERTRFWFLLRSTSLILSSIRMQPSSVLFQGIGSTEDLRGRDRADMVMECSAIRTELSREKWAGPKGLFSGFEVEFDGIDERHQPIEQSLMRGMRRVGVGRGLVSEGHQAAEPVAL